MAIAEPPVPQEEADSELLPGLNRGQSLAACTLEGPVMVVAGPGTGKTRTVAYRFKRLLEKGEDPEKVLVLTFTEKAASEMEERITTLCDLSSSELSISTFHSFALRFLELEGMLIPSLPQPFRIAGDAEKYEAMAAVVEGEHLLLDETDETEAKAAQQAWRERLFKVGLYRLPRPRDVVPHLLNLVERAKQELVTPVEYMQKVQAWEKLEGTDSAQKQKKAHTEQQKAIALIYSAYQTLLLRGGIHARQIAREGLIDYDDAIMYVANLLEDDHDVRKRYQKRYRYVMVDEFQDTNYAQLRIVQLIAGEKDGNLMVVGDDDQSIYRFRGASLASLRLFEQVYQSRVKVELEENYRSTEPIVERAHKLIAHNGDLRLDKPNRAMVPGPEVRAFLARSQGEEVAWILDCIQELLRSGVPAGEIAILFRTNGHMRPFPPALQQRSIPYQIYGGKGFLEQREIRDLRAFLQVLIDPDDSVAMARLIGMPAFQVPAEQIERLCREASDFNVALEDLIEYKAANDDSDTVLFRLQVLIDMVREMREHAQRESADELIHRVLSETGFTGFVAYENEWQREQVGANLTKFVHMAQNYCQGDLSGERDTVRDFMEYLKVVEKAGAEQGLATVRAHSGAIQLMTVHQAKGLEFQAVFCPCWVDGRFPSTAKSESLQLPEEFVKEEIPDGDVHMTEERRLAYVAITRAQTHLFFSCSERYGTGGKEWKPSRFLKEMGLVRKVGKDWQVADGIMDEARPSLLEESETLEAPPAEELPRELVTSYSDLADYEVCPARYRYRKVYKLPVRTVPEQEFGTIMHSVLQKVLLRAKEREVNLEEAIGMLRIEFQRTRFSDRANRESWLERGERMIEALYAKGDLRGAEAVEREFRLRLDLETLPLDDAGHTRKFTVVGRIDRLDAPGEDDAWTVTDYKTGSVGGPSDLSKDLQWGVYAMAAKQSLKLPKFKLRVVDIEGNSHEVQKVPAQLEADRKKIANLAAGIARGEFPTQPNSWKCSHCPFRLLCPDAE